MATMKSEREKSELPKKAYEHFTLDVSVESYKLKKNVHKYPVTFSVKGLLERIIPGLIFYHVKKGNMSLEELKKMLNEYAEYYMAHLLGIEALPIIEEEEG